ncbi:MAG: V-type ATP synthase subunit F [Actinomycetota bacterium]|nr:V-type ATP synthase subunit F [Actinomycetota bacterium]
MIEATARLTIVVPAELIPGFSVAGAEVRSAVDASEAAASVRDLIAEGERGVIGVYEPWFLDFDRSYREGLEASVAPVVIAIPSGLEAESGAIRRARLAGMLQRAVGYHITFGDTA